MIPASVCHAGKMAECIDVLFGVKTLETPETLYQMGDFHPFHHGEGEGV